MATRRKGRASGSDARDAKMLPKNGGRKDKKAGDGEQNQAPCSEQPALLCILMIASHADGL